MKLISFRIDGRASYGVVTGDGGVIDAGRRLGASLPDLRSALGGGMDRLRALAGETPDHRLETVRVRCPIPNPDKILCIGVNYH